MAELEEIYDEATLARLGAPTQASSGPRGVGGAPAAALATALSLGMREVMAPERPVEEIVEEVDLRTTAADESAPVHVVFVPHAPKLTRAYVRPWLLAGARMVTESSCSSTTSKPSRS